MATSMPTAANAISLAVAEATRYKSFVPRKASIKMRNWNKGSSSGDCNVRYRNTSLQLRRQNLSELESLVCLKIIVGRRNFAGTSSSFSGDPEFWRSRPEEAAPFMKEAEGKRMAAMGFNLAPLSCSLFSY
jgi:hypothetical protein